MFNGSIRYDSEEYESISNIDGGKGSGNFGHKGRKGQRGGSASKGTATFDKNGAPSAKELGFDESEYRKKAAEYSSTEGKTFLSSQEKQKIVDDVTKDIPKHVKTNNCDYEIDHFDYVGGQFSYKGTADGKTIGKEYEVAKNGKTVKAKAVSIHVYPNGKGEVNYNFEDGGISGHAVTNF